MFLQKDIDNGKLMQYESFKKALHTQSKHSRRKWPTIVLILLIAALFLPWTQNIKARGQVTTINPEQRPQEVNSLIPGRIVKWYVGDGATVKAGDTLLQLSEIKDDYLDPQLAKRTEAQLSAKNDAARFYRGKASTADVQISAIQQALSLKIAQLRNKLKQYTLQVQSDSTAMAAAASQWKISDLQLKRQKELYDAGLKSLTEYEQKQQYFQDALAKKISAENKFYNSKNELLNIQLELSAVTQDYTEKLSKTEGERFTALSQAATGEAEVSKLENQLYNYRSRKTFHYLIAPQSGQVVQNLKAGIGETVKDGEKILSIIPQQFEQAVEMFVSPNDLPLISKGQEVQIQFDGFPAIVFSGWPRASYGLFQGQIVVADNNLSENGKFRVWIKPRSGGRHWPAHLKFGTGCQTVTLLKNVPIWYELWRQLNGFPADFYKPEVTTKEKTAKK